MIKDGRGQCHICDRHGEVDFVKCRCATCDGLEQTFCPVCAGIYFALRDAWAAGNYAEADVLIVRLRKRRAVPAVVVAAKVVGGGE
jgi:hypothetical protein